MDAHFDPDTRRWSMEAFLDHTENGKKFKANTQCGITLSYS